MLYVINIAYYVLYIIISSTNRDNLASVRISVPLISSSCLNARSVASSPALKGSCAHAIPPVFHQHCWKGVVCSSSSWAWARAWRPSPSWNALGCDSGWAWVCRGGFGGGAWRVFWLVCTSLWHWMGLRMGVVSSNFTFLWFVETHLVVCLLCFLDSEKSPSEFGLTRNVHPEAAVRVVQCMARFMAAYFTNEPLCILPPHSVNVLPPLHIKTGNM